MNESWPRGYNFNVVLGQTLYEQYEKASKYFDFMLLFFIFYTGKD